MRPKQAQEQDWRGQHRILIGSRDDIEGDYGQLLASSTFCLMAPGVEIFQKRFSVAPN